MKILSNKDKREKDGKEKKEEEKTMPDEEIERQIKRPKKKKATGEDTLL